MSQRIGDGVTAKPQAAPVVGDRARIRCRYLISHHSDSHNTNGQDGTIEQIEMWMNGHNFCVRFDTPIAGRYVDLVSAWYRREQLTVINRETGR